MEPRSPSLASRAPRDTLDEVRDVARDLRSLDERLTGRLNSGAESFTLLRKAVSDAEAAADAALATARAAAAPKPIEWTRVVPIAIVLLSLFATVVATVTRTPSRDDVEARAAAIEGRLRLLDIELVAAQKELIEIKGALKSASEVASRRLDALEQAARPTRKGGK